MSKRFGRNQKRAMRAELSTACEVIKGLGRSVKNLQHKVSEHEGLVDTILEIIPRHFCAVAAEYVDAPHSQDRIEMAPILPKSFRELAYSPRSEITAVTRYALEILRIDLEEGRDPLQFQKMQHILVRSANNAWGLAITEESLRYMPIDELARDIAELLKQHPKLKGK